MKKFMLSLVAGILLLAGVATPAQAGDPGGWSLKAGQFLVTTPDGQVVPGQVVQGKAYDKAHVNKGVPQADPSAVNARLTSCSGTPPLCFFYGVGKQGPISTGIGLAVANLTQETPAVCGTDYHSLAEVSIETGSGSTRQIVEIGWTVDPALNGGSTAPYLFVSYFVNGVWKGYNGLSGGTFVDNAANPMNAGMALPAAGGVSKQYLIQYTGGNWWVSYDTNWVGYFPGTNWSGASPAATFTGNTNNLGQGFGELAASVTTPRSDMGNAILGTSTSSARVGSWEVQGGSVDPVDNFTPFQQSGTAVLAGTYAAAIRSGSVRTGGYGGPGWNLAGTGVGAPGC